MREETLINAVNDIDDIRCKLEDIHQYIMEQPDYWEKLRHRYAGMAMQGMFANPAFKDIDIKLVVLAAEGAATELINKLKEKSQCKEK